MMVSPPASVTTTPPMVNSVTASHYIDEDQESKSDLEQDRAYYTAYGRFVGQVAAAIDTRAGLIPTTCQVPLVDAPLFGDLDLHSQSCLLSSTELPPRVYADQLIDIYWRHVDPVEPVLDRQRFLENYEKAYSAPITSLFADYDLLLGILNLVFALAVQRYEQNSLHRRNAEGNWFFQRAWALLPAESMLWKPGSLELVQCLMLMNRYLHCTNNQQKTWMTAGLAMRIAQSMCCHLAEAPLVKDSSEDKALKRKVWASCVALDRLAARFRPPLLSQQDEYHSAALQLDACLQNWENSLPSDWQSQNLKMIADRSSRAERYLLHLRYLHHRIFLYRPMLARFYSMKPDIHSLKSPSLSHRLLRESASMCIEAAQQVALLVIESLELDEPIGLLPWWYRIYYLHIAGSNFLAAMFRSELFTDSVSQSWKDVLMALRAHEHLSPYVQQCVWTFETLAARITGKSPSLDGIGCGLIADGPAGACFDDIFKDVNFDFDSFIFGPEDFGEGLV
ncbi:Transcription factor [Penicillium griseofulvum]|uniref:Transcription factor n=1 Tax=Penicillium patulum TaxID=5078 RepID=A0A135LF75_PENPA|nr:Transcription factor [Penicillium griseofulvum]KXG47595.1 Transcription factor [Penicillium griseofulvum]